MQVHVGKDRMEELSTLLVCSEKGLIRMARSFPALLTMDPEDVVERLLALKVASIPCSFLCSFTALQSGMPLEPWP